MMQVISSKPGFAVLADGSIIARHGTQSNCAGIVQIHFQIEPIDDIGIQFTVAGTKDDSIDLWANPFISGANVPEEFQHAVRTGVTAGYLESARSLGIKFTLISAFVHPVDSNEFMFQILGKKSFYFWSKAFDEGFCIDRELD